MLLSNKSVRLNMYGIVLCFYLITGFIHTLLPLVVIGMFIEFFDRKDKIIIFCCLFFYDLVTSIRTVIRMPFIINWFYDIMNLVTDYQFNVENYIRLPEIYIPDWLSIPLLIILIIHTFIISIGTIILMIPFFLTTFLFIGIFFGNLNNFVIAIKDPNNLAFFANILLVSTSLEYLLLIPIISHFILKHIFKFYKRIPQLNSYS